MGAPFIHHSPTTSWIMRQVLWALVPGIFLLTFFFGPNLLINLIIANVSALAFEAGVLRLRHLPLKPALTDSSVLVTASLIAVSVPTTLSPFLLVLAVFFAVVITKHLYGGLGHNLFNPAMVAYVILLISFPLAMSQWGEAQMPAFFDSAFDATSQATPLDTFHNQHLVDWQLPWIIINLGWLLGGLYLFARKLIYWQSVAAFLLTLALLSQWNGGFSPSYQALLLHLLSGGTLLAAFFIITDPVTSPATPVGRLIFGASCALLTYVIRIKGGYPDGLAFSILMMNAMVPLLDRYTQPRVFGSRHV